MSADDRRRAPSAQPAFVLHAYDWSESSLILDLFTREEGRQVAAAKGAKRPYSQLRSVLLPFQCVQLQLSRARADAGEDEVRTLRTAEWGGGATILPASRLLSGYYLNELLMKFMPRGQAHPRLFEGYRQTLVHLSTAVVATDGGPTMEGRESGEREADLQGSAGAQVAVALRSFELLLLQEMGLLPDLAAEGVSGRALQPQARYALRPEMGLLPADEDAAGLQGRDWIGLQAALISGHLPALRAACQADAGPLKTALRGLLAYHLDGATLRTRDLMRELQRLPVLRSRSAAA